MRHRLAGHFALLCFVLLAAACVAASATDRPASIVVAGDSVAFASEYVGLDPGESPVSVDKVRFIAWVGSDSAGTVQEVSGNYGTLGFVRFAWPLAAFPANVAQTISYGIAYGHTNTPGGIGWSAYRLKTVAFTNTFLIPPPPAAAKVRVRTVPALN